MLLTVDRVVCLSPRGRALLLPGLRDGRRDGHEAGGAAVRRGCRGDAHGGALQLSQLVELGLRLPQLFPQVAALVLLAVHRGLGTQRAGLVILVNGIGIVVSVVVILVLVLVLVLSLVLLLFSSMVLVLSLVLLLFSYWYWYCR